MTFALGFDLTSLNSAFRLDSLSIHLVDRSSSHDGTQTRIYSEKKIRVLGSIALDGGNVFFVFTEN